MQSSNIVSLAFVIGILSGVLLFNGVGEDECPMSLVMLLVAFFAAGIGLRNRVTKTVVLSLAFFFAGLARAASPEVDIPFPESFMEWLGGLRRWVYDSFVSLGLKGNELSVVTAMTLGDKSGITHELKDVYAASGASHVLALSGMHLGIIYCVLMWVIYKVTLSIYVLPELLWEKIDVNRHTHLKNTLLWILRHQPEEQIVRHITSLTIILLIWTYVLLVGMMPSVVRAALMLTILTLARSIFRRLNTVSLLLLTAFITLLVSPTSIKDVGFQMSYMAVLGIGLIMPWLLRLVQLRWRFTRYVYELFCLSLSAQVMVAPLSLYYFHRVAIIGLVTGVVVSFTALGIVVLAMAVIVLMALGFTDLAQIVAYCLSWITMAQNEIVEYLAVNF